jgi:colanic acid/amylovoran biosynthesis protein
MKTVMIYAYTRFNLGDDLFVKVLCERYPGTNFVLKAPRYYNQVFKELENLSIYSDNSLLQKGTHLIKKKLKLLDYFPNRLLKKCDAAIHIGGSLFIQGDNWKRNILNTKSMRYKNMPFFLLGANFGPFIDKEYFQAHKEIFKDYTDICFRENHSFEIFKDLNNVRMANDIIFQLKSEKEALVEKKITISVIKPSTRRNFSHLDDIYYKKIKQISLFYIERGYKVTLMSFCEYEGDKEAVGEIKQLIPSEYHNQVIEYLYKFNIKEALEVIATSKFIIATRFHAMILGWVYNKPVYPIVYSKKMTNVIEDSNFRGDFIELENIQTLDPEEIYESLQKNVFDVSILSENAEKQFEKLDEYLLNS